MSKLRRKSLEADSKMYHELIQRIEKTEVSLKMALQENVELREELSLLQTNTNNKLSVMSERIMQLAEENILMKQTKNEMDTKILVGTTKWDVESRKLSAELLQRAQNGLHQASEAPGRVEPTIPKFGGEQTDEHPKRFLKDLTIYMNLRNI